MEGARFHAQLIAAHLKMNPDKSAMFFEIAGIQNEFDLNSVPDFLRFSEFLVEFCHY